MNTEALNFELYAIKLLKIEILHQINKENEAVSSINEHLIRQS